MWMHSVFVILISFAFADDSLPWWKTANFYQVYPRSFKDGDGDGIGDLKGITQAADYFKEIGVDAIWMNPIYKSPMADFGYDVSDFTTIESIFGNMDDFEDLVAKLRSLDVKLLIDFVPNHTSDEHLWFQHSLNPNDPLFKDYKDFYVWQDPKGIDPQGHPIPPNNWQSEFGGPAWTYREERGQFYLHHFLEKQPDLNFRCPELVDNMTDILNFWLYKGIDGFRLDAVKYMVENDSFPDEPPLPGTDGDTFFNQQHIYEFNQPETYNLLRQWAQVVMDRVNEDGRPRAMFLEVYDSFDNTMKYYGTGDLTFEYPFNFFLLTHANASSRPADFKALIDNWMQAMPPEGVASWTVGNHDNRRVADRYGPEMVDAINMLTGVLPGVKVTYNGEEIGMSDTFIRWDQTKDPYAKQFGPQNYLEHTRDINRTPLQWDGTVGAGFSTNASTWLPLNPNYWWLNIAAQRAAPISHLKVFQALSKARQDPVLLTGDYEVLVPNNDTLIIVRSLNRISLYVLIINMGSDVVTYTSDLFASQQLDLDMEVVIGSVNSQYSPGTMIKKGSQNMTLRPKAAVLLKTPSASSSASTSTALAPLLFLLLGTLTLN